MIKVSVVRRSGYGWQLKYTDPVSGRQVKKSAKTKDRREAERKAAKLETELAAGTVQGEMRWEVFRLRFEDEHLSTLAIDTQDNFRVSFDRFERDVGKPVIRNITPMVLSQWKTSMLKSGNSPATVSTYLRNVRTALNWAAKMGIISVAPKIIMPSGSGSRGRPITITEFIAFLRCLIDNEKDPTKGDGLANIAKAMWLSGLRISEIIKIRIDEDGPITLDFSQKRPVFRFRQQKNKKQQVIPATPDFARFAHRFRGRSGAVFDCGFAVSTVIKRFSLAGKATGVHVSNTKSISSHDLRRTFGQRWALRVHPMVLKELMRHKSIETTLRFYVDLDAAKVGDSIWKDVPAFVPDSRDQQPNWNIDDAKTA